MRTVELLRRAAGKPPSYLARRALREAERIARRGWLRRRIRNLTAEKLAREAGYPSLSAMHRGGSTSPVQWTDESRARMRRLYAGRYGEELEALRNLVVPGILAHEFDLLGSGPTSLGRTIDWHLDFKSGKKWPLEPSRGIDYADLSSPSDVKVPWELSRCHHLVTLGQAWLLDQDSRAVGEFESQVASWILSNPVGFGVNWACAMEVAIRAVNWSWAMALFADAPLPDSFWDECILAFYKHGLWLPESLEVSHINGNHYIADALGLVACGAYFRVLPEGRRWLELGQKILEQEIRLQVEEDGVDIEGSIPYHRLVLEIFLVGARLLRTAGHSPSAAYMKKLEHMTEFVHAYTAPNGHAPVFGDADDGRVLVFGRIHHSDHRYLLSTGCVLFQRADWKERAERYWEDSLWLLGPASVESYDQISAEDREGSRAFPVSGIYTLRSRSQFVLIDAAPVGFRGLGGHGHNDCLSFEWHAGQNPILTDSGLFVYTASPEWRDRFRSTEFHNTIRVDGQEINRFLSPPTLWFLGNDAQPVDVRFEQGESEDLLCAGHTGYRRLADPVTVFRTFAAERAAPTLLLTDRLEGREEHTVEFFFHFAPGADVRFVSESYVDIQWPGRVQVSLERQSGPPVHWEEKQGWFAPSYGIKVPRTVCVAEVHCRLPFSVTWKMTAHDRMVRPQVSAEDS